MTLQKIKADQIKAESIDGTELKDGSITNADIALTTITLDRLNISANTVSGTLIQDLTIAGSKLANATVTSTKIANATIVGSNIATGTITSTNILDGTILNVDISTAAAIDTTKIDWTTLTQTEAVQQVTKQPEGIFFQNYDLEGATTFVSPTSATTSFIQHFYLPCPMTVNYFTYIITSGSSLYKSRVVIWDGNNNRIFDSGDQSAAAGTYKINVPALYLLPGIYYIGFMSNYTSARFLSQAAPAYSVIPQRGTLNFTTWGTWANPLVPANITMSASKQPWFAISKY